MHSFAGLIRRTPPPTFSDTAITDRHSGTTNFQLRAHWVRISWSISSSELTGCGYPGLLDRKNRSDMCPRWESNPRLPACKAGTLSTRPGSPLSTGFGRILSLNGFIMNPMVPAWTRKYVKSFLGPPHSTLHKLQ